MTPTIPSEDTKSSLLAAFGDSGAGGDPLGDTPDTVPSAPVRNVRAPESICGVRLLRLLGRGGMGDVYLGHHDAFGIEVAVKLLRSDICDVDKLQREAHATASIQHPNVVRVFHAGSENERCFLIMELISGGDVGTLVEQNGGLPWRRATNLAIQAAEGLGAAHRAGFLHRDVKPSNLLLAPDGTLKLADLGLAQLRGKSSDEKVKTGTPAFMAPELAAGEGGTWSDVYALGVTLYYMLTGSRPPKIDAGIPDLRSVLPDIPARLARVVSRMTSADPAQRPVDGNTAAAELREALYETVDASSGYHKRVQNRKMRVMAAAAIALVFVATSGAVASFSYTPPKEPKGIESAKPRPAPAPAAPAAAANAAPAWHTPTRAVFVIAEGLPLETEEAIEVGLRSQGLIVVERQQVAQLVAEQDLGQQGRLDLTTAITLGRLVGGHIGIFAKASGNTVRLSTVSVETGERLSSAAVPFGKAAESAASMVNDAIATLPARGHLNAMSDGRFSVDLGQAHGLRKGSTLVMRSGTDERPGTVTGTAVVTEVARDAAFAKVDGTVDGHSILIERSK